MLITNGKLYTMRLEEALQGYDLRIEGKRIQEIAQGLKPKKGEAVIDAKGGWVLPGFIDAHTHLGMMEAGYGWEGHDLNENSDPLVPEMRGIDGCNPLEASFSEARSSGVTTVMTGPGSADPLGGTWALIRTWGTVIDKMVLNPYVAMKSAFGENPKRAFGQRGNQAPVTRMATAALLRKGLIETKNYMARKAKAAEKGEPFDINLKWEQMIPVLERKAFLKAHAHRADDILTSIRIAKEFNLKMTLDHCTEGHLIADRLKQESYGALVGPTLMPASKVELQNKGFHTVVSLVKAGVKTAIVTDHPFVGIGLLTISAGYAWKAGLSLMEALRCITLSPAEILEIDADYGSLEPGKLANITIFDDNPLFNMSHCLFTIGEGEVIWKDPQLA